MFLVLIIGPTKYIIVNTLEPVSYVIKNYLSLSLVKSKYSLDWTVFYWAWYIALAPAVGAFIVNISNNKTIEKLQYDQKRVLDIGGLCVIGTERHESRRIDNQLRGRSGRQGDPGKSKFFISLEDDLMRIFGSEKLNSMLKKLGLKEGEAIFHPWITKAIEKAQSKVESRNFEIRKNLLKFDDVMNDQRQVVFEQRREIMSSENVSTGVKLPPKKASTAINELKNPTVASLELLKDSDVNRLVTLPTTNEYSKVISSVFIQKSNPLPLKVPKKTVDNTNKISN